MNKKTLLVILILFAVLFAALFTLDFSKQNQKNTTSVNDSRMTSNEILSGLKSKDEKVITNAIFYGILNGDSNKISPDINKEIVRILKEEKRINILRYALFVSDDTRLKITSTPYGFKVVEDAVARYNKEIKSGEMIVVKRKGKVIVATSIDS
ncbi:MAG: hypothetical protein ACYTFY_15640 [Planctomycetota bacterium]|jgi:hypothetical protein